MAIYDLTRVDAVVASLRWIAFGDIAECVRLWLLV